MCVSRAGCTGSATTAWLDQLKNGGVTNAAERIDAAGVPAWYAPQFQATEDAMKAAGGAVPQDQRLLRAIFAKRGANGVEAWVQKHGAKGLPAAALMTGGGFLSGLRSPASRPDGG